MRRISELAERELRWVTGGRSRGRGYHLRDGDDTVATLRFRGTWSSFATAASADGSWTFQRVGVMQNRTIIRAADGDRDIATFRSRTWGRGGTLELSDGRRVEADTNMWMTRFSLSTETGEPLVLFTKIGGALSWRAHAEITPAGAGVKDAPWLAMLGWYVSVQMRKDAAA